MARTQYRGHCQACGRQQAATDGNVAKHGYSVEHGYFRGTCPGSGHFPMERDTSLTTVIVAKMRSTAIDLLAKADAIKNHTFTPKAIERRDRSGTTIEVPWDHLASYEQFRWRDDTASRFTYQAQSFQSGADQLETLAKRVHGMPLVEVSIVAPDRIKIGEARMLNGRRVRVFSVFGQRVRYIDSENRRWYTSPAAWRKLPIAPEQETTT